ncbi:hypothetical protein R3W88_012202 [Solanum pinnatisectum]|uniref:Retrotransposon gag domain-containing protein n=1 Tax=Solanum pinnatisectum TaxID=50273 RepID=A0AAV9LB71_9SOLN|nr:hypothetical protein R3W88_012202 [Solanum pinnatisectum]
MVPIPPPKWELPSFEGREPKEELIRRFEDEFLDDIVEQFNRLVQIGSVDEFFKKFEDLKTHIPVKNPHLNDAHFLSSLVGSLKEKIRFVVKMFKQTTLKLAIEKGRMQAKAIEVVQTRNKVTAKPTIAMSQNSIPKVLGSSTSRPNAFKLSPEVYEYKKRKGYISVWRQVHLGGDFTSIYGGRRPLLY